MKNYFARFFTFLLTACFAILNFSSQAEATVVKGYAAIMNGDVAGAKAEAKRQAMRELVEQEQLGFELNLQNMAPAIISSKKKFAEMFFTLNWTQRQVLKKFAPQPQI